MTTGVQAAAEEVFQKGVAAHVAGHLDQALQLYGRALALMPGNAVILGNIGAALQDQGRADAAVACLRQAVVSQPDHAQARYNLGNALAQQGDSKAAAMEYGRATELKPDLAEAHFNLGNILTDSGRFAEALARYQLALRLDPENGLFWSGFAHCVRTMNLTRIDDGLFPYLFKMLEQPTVRPKEVSGSIIRLIRNHAAWSSTFNLLQKDQWAGDIEEAVTLLSAIPLLLRLLQSTPVADLKLEKILTRLRCAMLERAVGGAVATGGIAFYAAMAHHCFINEYLFAEESLETEKIASLTADIEGWIAAGRMVPAAFIAVLAAYRPLGNFAWSKKLSQADLPQELHELLVRQVEAPNREREIAASIPRAAPVTDTVSQAVRQQYEENPYPRWVTTALCARARSVHGVLQEIDIVPEAGGIEFAVKPHILIAGCGTGQHALITASRFQGCKVLAVDLSVKSLSYAARKTGEYGMDNIDFMQCDILQLHRLGRQFDIVESVGVIHHMDDPMAGWRSLAAVLRPQGLMKIGLYSAQARKHIVAIRKLVAADDQVSSPRAIRQRRAKIIDMALGGDASAIKLARSNNFYSLSECRDLLFHVQEHRLTLEQIAGMIKELDLEFLGFEFGNDKNLKKFKERHPDKAARRSLELWHRFELENPDAFIGMYQFWLLKK